MELHQKSITVEDTQMILWSGSTVESIELYLFAMNSLTPETSHNIESSSINADNSATCLPLWWFQFGTGYSLVLMRKEIGIFFTVVLI